MKFIFRTIIHMPGVIVHELAHHFFCILFQVKVTKVCYYNFFDSSGYVEHKSSKHLHQEVFIAIAPFFINSLLGAIVAYPTIIYKLSITGLEIFNWEDVFRVILSISIGMHAIPSKQDGLSTWEYISHSNHNFIYKFLARLVISPLILIIYLLNFCKSFLKIDLLYGICVCIIGPKLIDYLINSDKF